MLYMLRQIQGTDSIEIGRTQRNTQYYRGVTMNEAVTRCPVAGILQWTRMF